MRLSSLMPCRGNTTALFPRVIRAGGCLVLGAALWMTMTADSEANIIISAQEVGSDVVFSITGSLDTTNFGSAVTTSASISFVNPSRPAISFEANTGNIQSYNLGAPGTPYTWPTFGSGTSSTPSGLSADNFYVAYNSGLNRNVLELPLGYTSGTAISGTMTFTSETLLSMGITPGTYTFQVPNDGASQTQVIQLQAVPEPSTTSMLSAVAILGGGWISRRKRLRRGAGA